MARKKAAPQQDPLVPRGDKYLQLHLLTAYGPSNLNRDDNGRPKSTFFGGVSRLRISSQALKRVWRTSEVFRSSLPKSLSVRTQRLGDEVADFFVNGGLDREEAVALARMGVESLGKLKPAPADEPAVPHTEEMVFLSMAEWEAVFDWAKRMQQAIADGTDRPNPPTRDDILRHTDETAADIGMFGRMVAHDHRFNRPAAVQVSHAVTTHRSFAQEDYYVALDDLNAQRDDGSPAAGFVGTRDFGSGVFYLYLCVDLHQLYTNLSGNSTVYLNSLDALVEAACTVGPKGMQNSFASHARAFYVLAERGSMQPCSLLPAFLRPVEGNDLGAASVEALSAYRNALAEVYGRTPDKMASFNVLENHGSLHELMTFARMGG